jgi:hypothetical protein
MSLRTIFLVAFWSSLVPMFFVARYGENHWRFDSLGAWFTVVYAISFAFFFAAIVRAAVKLVRALRSSQAEALGDGNGTDA